MNTAGSGAPQVNEPFTNGPKGGGRSRRAIGRPAPENRAARSCMTGALHRARGSRQAAYGAISASNCALLSGNRVWGQARFGRPLHDCLLSGVGGSRHGR